MQRNTGHRYDGDNPYGVLRYLFCSVVFYGSGFISVAMIIGYLYRAWVNGKKFNGSMIMVFIFTLIESSVFMNTMLIIYMILITTSGMNGRRA